MTFKGQIGPDHFCILTTPFLKALTSIEARRRYISPPIYSSQHQARNHITSWTTQLLLNIPDLDLASAKKTGLHHSLHHNSMKCCYLRRSLRCSRDCASCCSWPNHLGGLTMFLPPLSHMTGKNGQICFGFLVLRLCTAFKKVHAEYQDQQHTKVLAKFHHVSPCFIIDRQSHARWNHHGPWWSWWNGKVHVHPVRKDQGCHKHVWQIGLSCQGLLWWSPSRSLGTSADGSKTIGNSGFSLLR